jgi:hypothetical protein
MPQRVEDWIASSLSLLAMTPEFKQAYHPRGATRPIFCRSFRPSENKGRGECRVPISQILELDCPISLSLLVVASTDG